MRRKTQVFGIPVRTPVILGVDAKLIAGRHDSEGLPANGKGGFMDEREAASSPSDWNWVADDDLLVGFLMFVHGISAERIISKFGMDSATGQVLRAEQVEENLRYPVYNSKAEIVHPWLRAGTCGDWSFAFDQSGIRIYEYQRVAQELSRKTSLALVTWTPTIDGFSYWEDGTEVTSFEPGRWYERNGSEPDRFLPQLRQLDLYAERPAPGEPSDWEERWEIPLVAVLEMLTLAFGIRLPARVANGPLLTVQRA